MSVKDILISDYTYPLPEERIALHPVEDRAGCRLLYCGRDGETGDYRFSALPELLPADSLMICNNTRVINARLRFRKSTGSEIEVFLLEPLRPSDYSRMFSSRGECEWRCIIGNLKRWKSGSLSGEYLLPSGERVTLYAERGEPLGERTHSVKLAWSPAVSLIEVLEAAGRIPIPPYLNRDTEDSDSIDYQTVYSKIEGSVAAPTAGLHFTPEVMEELKERGIEREELTLHVGAGTFLPVKSEHIGGHAMHTEVYSVSRRVVESLTEALRAGRPIVAIGTTSVRTLESLPLAGRNLLRGESGEVTQWEAYEKEALECDTLHGLEGLLGYMQKNDMREFTSSTSIMIAPGFKWRIANLLVTNFHQPESTLLLLISSFLGKEKDGSERWRRIYEHALRCEYRFLSYGDACLFERNQG